MFRTSKVAARFVPAVFSKTASFRAASSATKPKAKVATRNSDAGSEVQMSCIQVGHDGIMFVPFSVTRPEATLSHFQQEATTP